MVLIAVPALALGALCERLVYDDGGLVLVLLYAPNSGHHNPVFAQRWDVPTDASDEGSVQFAWGDTGAR